MKSLIFSIGILLVTGMIVGGVAIAATTGDITATVTAQNVAITVGDGTVAYGIVAVSGNADTTSGGVDDTQLVTNTGNVNGDISITGTNSANWTLESTIGAEQYVHKSCTTTCDSSPTWTEFAEAGYTTLENDVAPAGTIDLDLQLLTPSSTGTFTEQSVDVTVQIAAS